jgi:hypothetical protein
MCNDDPHPHASISHLSVYPHEKEVLILPFFKFKEIGRTIDKNLTYIRLQQDSDVAYLSLSENKSTKNWVDVVFYNHKA